MSYEHGRILAVNETRLGSELVADHAAGVLSLTVEDPVDFDEDGGWLKVGDEVIEYTTYDDDTGEIALKTAIASAAFEGDRVFLWDELRQVVTTDKIAQVELDGDDDNTDPLEATIPLHLLDDLAEGIRGTRGESVLLEQDGDEWRIVDVLGLAAAGASGTQFWQDAHAVTAAGEQTIALTHEPIDNSEHLYWNGLYQPASQWSRSSGEKTITVPDSGGHLSAGDELVVEYAYRVGVAAPEIRTLPFGSAGWKYLQVATGDTTDRSAVGYNDNTWATGTTPLSDRLTAYPLFGWLPPAAAAWALGTDMWLRRVVTATPGSPVTVTIRVDNTTASDGVYWNGSRIGDMTNTESSVTVPAELVQATNTLAIRAGDDADNPGGDRTYIDVSLEGAR